MIRWKFIFLFWSSRGIGSAVFALGLVVAGSSWAASSELDRSGKKEQQHRHKISVRPLDQSRTPTTDELMAAGQLGGVLFPTHELKNKGREASIHSDFGIAIEEWNKHGYPKAVQLFKKHVEKFPDSPWAAEAILHVGCDATYNGRYKEAETIFTQIIADNQNATDPGARMMLNKARQRLALVKVEQNNLEEATRLFNELKDDSADWKLRTYAIHWLQRISSFNADREALLNCGADCLGYVLEKEGNLTASKHVRQQLPKTTRGHSINALVKLAADQGREMTALQITTADLAQLPLPAVMHIRASSAGDKGHYWVLDKIQGNQVELFDPQSTRRFQQTVDELAVQWSGNVLVFTKGHQLPGRKLDVSEMDEALGGCCGVPTAPSNQGAPGANGISTGGGSGGAPGTPSEPSKCGGAPVWRVNVVNMNFYVTDTPMWYDPPIGPSVRISVSYNSQSSIAHREPFGNKWTFGYGGYLVMDTSGTITVFMPDGRLDVYTPNGVGGYNRPYRIHNTLTQIAPNHFQLTFPDGSAYVYQIPPGTSSQQPFLTAIRDAYGQTLTLSYDTNVNLTALTDAQGKVFTLTYNSSGLVTNVSDPFGRVATFQYDTNNNLTRITDMGGYFSTLSYDTNVFVTSIGDDRGTWLFRTEPADGIPNGSNPYPAPGTTMWQNYRITVTNPLGQSEEFHYNAYSSYSYYVSARDYVPWRSQSQNTYSLNVPRTKYNFVRTSSGTRGEISKITYPEGDFVQYGYDPVTGDRTSVTDSHGHVWHYTYNSLGRVNSVTDAKGTRTSFTYAANGFDLLSISNGLGVISMTYDTNHDLLTATDRLNNTTRFAYDSYGHLTSRVDALGFTNIFVYDVSNRLAQFGRAGFTLGSFTYDPVGRLLASTDATGLSVTNTYNNLNQTLGVIFPDGRSNTFVYSTCCPRIVDSVTDRGGRTNTFVYDAMKRLTHTINPELGVLQFGYDANGNRTSLTDPNGNVTKFAYDLDNRLTNKAYADGKGLSFRYDSNGLLINRTNARGIVTTYSYDANHNVVAKSYSDGTPSITNTFDAFNRLIAVTDAVGVSVYSYDANSRLTTFDGPWASDTITNLFDALGRMTNLLVQGSQPVGYVFDALNRLTGVQVGAGVYAYTYGGGNPLVQRLDRPNGSYTTYQYDGLNRLTDIANKQSGGQIINEFSYTYNAQDLRDSETISNGLSFSFSTNQLVTYNYNQLNQVLTSAPPSQIFSYDDDGNMTQGYTVDVSKFFAAFDAENRLKSLVYTNGSAVTYSNHYVYGWKGFLAQIKEYQSGILSNEMRFIRAGYLPRQERGFGNNIVREYAWGLNKGGGIGGLLNLVQGGQSYSYTYDGKGNVVAVIDGSQSLASAYTYEPFGVLIATSGSLDQPFRFSTKHYDPKTGQIDFGYRHYLPPVGRWLNRDPIGVAGGINLYGYVANNPVNRRDHLGLSDGQCHPAEDSDQKKSVPNDLTGEDQIAAEKQKIEDEQWADDFGKLSTMLKFLGIGSAVSERLPMAPSDEGNIVKVIADEGKKNIEDAIENAPNPIYEGSKASQKLSDQIRINSQRKPPTEEVHDMLDTLTRPPP